MSAALLITAGLALIRKPRASTTVMLVDDQGYKFGDDSTGAILAGTRFDVTSDDARDRPMGKDDGSHGEIVLMGLDLVIYPETRSNGGWTTGPDR